MGKKLRLRRGRRPRSHRGGQRGQPAHHARERQDHHRHVLLPAVRRRQRGGRAPQRHLLGDLVRGPALQQARAQERLPHRDRRHRLRLVQHRVHRQAPGPALQPAAEPAQDRVHLRGFLLRPGRHRVGAVARAKRVRACRTSAASSTTTSQTINDITPDHRQAQAAQPRRRPPHRLHQRRRALLAAGARAELPVQGPRARRRHRLRLQRFRQGAGQRRQRRVRPRWSPAPASSSSRSGRRRRRSRRTSGDAVQKRTGAYPLGSPPARRRRTVAAQAGPRQVADATIPTSSAPPCMSLDLPVGHHDQRLGREVRRERPEQPTSACSTTCCSGRTASWSRCGRRSSRPIRAKWIPLGALGPRK